MLTNAYSASLATENDDQPWLQYGEGVSSKLLALFHNNAGWVSLLQLEPGARIPPHRHRGAVHSFILSGHRRFEPTGRILGPGEYDFEPPGNVDTWSVEGDDPLVGLFIVLGMVEYLDQPGHVIRLETTSSKDEACRRACAEQGITPFDLYR